MRPAALFALLLLAPLCWAESRALTWGELIPADSAPATGHPAPLHDPQWTAEESGPRAAQQVPDAPVVAALHGQQVKLPGYIVPLQTDAGGRVTELLLVPYFGACIHVPPPASNQILYVRFAAGVPLQALWQPYWVEGPLRVEAASSELAEAGYQMDASRIYLYPLDP
jgi:hypothetical protein